MRVLIVEDNKELNQQMKETLMEMGMYADSALSGIDGEDKAFCNEYDAILLDLNLPDKDGMEILKNLRAEHITTPVLIISARDELQDRIQGLNLGADDYILKPFEMSELYARIYAISRRYHGHSSNQIKKDHLFLDIDSRKAYYDEQEIDLAAKEFDILEYLMIRHPSVVSSEEIAEHVYDENFNPFSSVLRVHIARLKKKLLEASQREILKTIRGKGYYLCLEES